MVALFSGSRNTWRFMSRCLLIISILLGLLVGIVMSVQLRMPLNLMPLSKCAQSAIEGIDIRLSTPLRSEGMAYSIGFEWNDYWLKRVERLKINGLTDIEIANVLTEETGHEFTYGMISTTRNRYNITGKYLEIDKEIRFYEADAIPMDDYMVSCDHHSPFYSEVYENRLIAIADRFGIRKHIIIGDLFDMDFIKRHPVSEGEETLGIEREVYHSDPVISLCDYFDENYLITGNHERRVGIQTEAKIQAQHLFGLFGKEVWDNKFRYSVYDKLFIGEDWMVVHPVSYSQISTAVARRLAEKFGKNIINSHGHFVGMTYDRSGKYLAIDLGGMFDIRKIAYINLRTTSHPVWKNGFGMLRDGKFWHFTDETDFNYWL